MVKIWRTAKLGIECQKKYVPGSKKFKRKDPHGLNTALGGLKMMISNHLGSYPSKLMTNSATDTQKTKCFNNGVRG